MIVTEPNVVEMRCKACNNKLFDYVIQNNDSAYVLNNVCMKCARCRRAIVFAKYTEAMVRRAAVLRNDCCVAKL